MSYGRGWGWTGRAAFDPLLPWAAQNSASQLDPRVLRFARRNFLFRWSELNARIGRVPLKAMRRRDFVTLLGGAAAWPLAARAQQATRPPRIGWLSIGSPISHRLSLAAFQDGLRALGYIEGGNFTIEYRWAEGNLTRLPELANQLVQQQVEIILAGGSTGAQAAKDATSVIPII